MGWLAIMQLMLRSLIWGINEQLLFGLLHMKEASIYITYKDVFVSSPYQCHLCIKLWPEGSKKSRR
jgi:hypothetical protein